MSEQNLIERLEINPLSYYIWQNDYKKLKSLLATPLGQKLIEKRDVRGRTPLMLSVSLGHFECSRLLIGANAEVNIDDDDGFNVLHEAIATNDPELVQLVLEKRELQRASKRAKAIPALLRKIRDTPDFYLEMKWEFTSWVPLLSKICPSDTYKIYKRGSSVRIDTSLSGFEQMSWQRGNRTYIFTASDDACRFLDINHDNRQVHIDKIMLSELANEASSLFASSSDVMAAARLTCPTSITYIDTDRIVFERSKSGIIGFRTDRTDIVNGYECKVYNANVQLVSKTRTEHLSDADKKNYKEQMAASSMPFQSIPFLNTVEIVEKNYDEESGNSAQSTNGSSNYNLSRVTLEQYFDPAFSIQGHDIGRPREITTKINKFKTHLWLSEQFPLSLQEQILPIIELMAISSSHFTKLKDFITAPFSIPPGFPVKIEIPLFHIVNARVSFGNIFSLNERVDKVQPIKDGTSCACIIDESVFEIPANYSYLGNDDPYEQSSDEYVDMALQRYISNDRLTEHMPAAGNGHNGSANGSATNYFDDQKDPEMQRAIEESLRTYNMAKNSALDPSGDYELERQKIEELELEKALKLSLIEK